MVLGLSEGLVVDIDQLRLEIAEGFDLLIDDLLIDLLRRVALALDSAEVAVVQATLRESQPGDDLGAPEVPVVHAVLVLEALVFHEVRHLGVDFDVWTRDR